MPGPQNEAPIHLLISEERNKAATLRRTLGGRVTEQGEVSQFHLTAGLASEEVIMAQKKIDAGTQVLWCLGCSA